MYNILTVWGEEYYLPAPFYFLMNKNILIIHYNTPELTKATVLSVIKHCPDCEITVFDNSDKYPFELMSCVTVINNCNQQLLDFDTMINSFNNKAISSNGYGSAKHCYSVDYCMDMFEDGFVLLDSDVLVKRDLSELFDSSVCWAGQSHINKKHKINIPRLYPFCCFINTKMCRENGIRYFDREHMWQLSDSEIGKWYDTGAWFLEATNGLPHKDIVCTDYIVHYGNGSFNNTKKQSKSDWLNQYSEYYR